MPTVWRRLITDGAAGNGRVDAAAADVTDGDCGARPDPPRPVGDLFNVTLIYDAKMPHSIDLHASRTATDKSMRELAPEQSLVYQFQAQYSGIFMCHCGAAPALEHIANGMFGAVVIDSWRGLGPGSSSSEVSRSS
jgi:Multicopper oxidase